MTVRKSGGGRKRLLIAQITGYSVGGVERYCNNILEHIDLAKYEITYFTPQGIFDQSGAERLRQMGIDMHAGNLALPPESASVREKLLFHGQTISKFRKLCREKSFDIIHVNTGSVIYQAYMMFFARLFGIKKRISHSHNADFGQNFTCLRPMVVCNATDLLACSDLAAKGLFGEKAARRAMVVKNGIDLEKFVFSAAVRAEYRAKLGIGESDFVVGHVGAFNAQKNHRFLIEIFQAAADKDLSVKLLLVGAGGLEQEIRDRVKMLGLEEKVIFAGIKKDVGNYYCAMDVFAMPSLYEGLPFVGIEAQASGLFCCFSDQMTREVKVTEHAAFLPIQDANLWAERILAVRKSTLHREDAWMAVREAGYDVRECAAEVERLYDGA